MSAHTKGPWHCKFDAFDADMHITTEARETEDRVEICRVSVGYDEPFESEQQANARLISAAPELLEVARKALPILEAAQRMIAAEAARRGMEPDDTLLNAIRTAVSKAEAT